MPVPVQLGALTTRLRNFLRIRGRLRLSLDETIVPTVQVQDLTVGPYIAGVTPASGTLVFPALAAGGNQAAILLNPDATTLLVTLPPLPFEGRSWSFDYIELINRTGSYLGTIKVYALDRLTVFTIPGSETAITRLVNIQGDPLRGFLPPQVPVVQAAFPGTILTNVASEIATVSLNAQGNAGSVHRIDGRPAITIGPNDSIVIHSLSSPIADGFVQMNLRGFYQEQPG